MLDAVSIRRAQFDPQGTRKQVIWDTGGIPGFGLRIHPSGTKSFVLRYALNGRERLLTLGTVGEQMTLTQARDRAAAERLKIRAGIDPAADRKAARIATTVEDLCATYLERHAKPHKRSWKSDERRLRYYIVPSLGALPLASVTRADVALLLTDIGEKKFAAPKNAIKGRGAVTRGGGKTESNRVQALLHTMFELARDWGYIAEQAPNPAARIKRYREQSRERFITDDELPALFHALEQEENHHASAAIELALLTGCRRGELEGLTWRCVDLGGRVLRLGTTKNGRPHHVPLSTAAVQLLHNLPRLVGNDFVFPSPTMPGRALDISGAWQRIRQRAGLTDVTFHDLRRSAASHMASAGVGLGIIGSLLNHASTSTTSVYARIANVAVRDAVEAHGERLRIRRLAK